MYIYIYTELLKTHYVVQIFCSHFGSHFGSHFDLHRKRCQTGCKILVPHNMLLINLKNKRTLT